MSAVNRDSLVDLIKTGPKTKWLPQVSKYFENEVEDDLLESIPAEVGEVWILGLTHRCQHSKDRLELLKLFYEFFAHLSRACIRSLMKEFKELCITYVSIAESMKDYKVLITHTLANAVDNLDSVEEEGEPPLTPLHADLVEWARESRCDLALKPILGRHYSRVDKQLDMPRARVLSFFENFAELLIRQGDYQRAAEYLTVLFCAPNKSTSKTRAFSKWQLSSVMADGKPRACPKLCPDDALDAMRKATVGYDGFVNSFADLDKTWKDNVPKAISENGDTQLYYKCAERRNEEKILRQQQAFISLRLSEFPALDAKERPSKEQHYTQIEDLLTQMMIRKRLHGKLSYSSGGETVFTFDSSAISVSKQVEQLEAALNEVAEASTLLDKSGRSVVNRSGFAKALKEYPQNRGSGKHDVFSSIAGRPGASGGGAGIPSRRGKIPSSRRSQGENRMFKPKPATRSRSRSKSLAMARRTQDSDEEMGVGSSSDDDKMVDREEYDEGSDYSDKDMPDAG